MGSYLSCVSSYILPSNTIKIIHFNGSLQEFQTQIKAAEIMLENPQHFVCHADSLKVGRRFSPLPADENLDSGHLYFVLPMSKLQSALSGSDMASIAFKASSAMKRSSKNGGKFLPIFGDLRTFMLQERGDHHHHLHGEFHERTSDLKIVEASKMNIFEGLSELQTDLEKYRLRKHWKPKLETIGEAERLRATFGRVY